MMFSLCIVCIAIEPTQIFKTSSVDIDILETNVLGTPNWLNLKKKLIKQLLFLTNDLYEIKYNFRRNVSDTFLTLL